MALHQTAGFSIANQSAKGTAASTNFIRGRMRTSSANVRFDVVENTGEHTGIHQRPTTRQSVAIRAGYIVDVAGEWMVRPYMLGVALLMAGFKVTTTADSPEVGLYTHTFTLADADEIIYGSVIRALGEGVNRAERLITDVILSQLVLTADRSGLRCNIEGRGVSEGNATGTETHTADPDFLLSQANGSFTLTSSDLTAATVGTPRSNVLTIQNPLDEEEQELHDFKRSGFAPNGMDITGTLGGLVWGADVEKEFVRGSSSGTTPAIKIPEAALSWSFQSPANITGKSNPYSVSVSIAKVQMNMQPFDVTQGGRIVYEAAWEMIDDAASSPITITIVNDKANYNGS